MLSSEKADQCRCVDDDDDDDEQNKQICLKIIEHSAELFSAVDVFFRGLNMSRNLFKFADDLVLVN